MSRADWLVEDSPGFNRSIKGFKIQSAYFATDPGYANGEVYLLHWIGMDSEGNTYDAEGFHPSWPAPKGFISMDSGKSIQHPEGFKLRNNGLLGRLAKAIFEVTEGANPDPLENFTPTESTGYVGLTFDLDTVDINYGGEIGVKQRLMPVGFAGGSGTAAAAGGPDLRTSVMNLAKAANSFDEFRTGALALPGVSSDSALVTEIIDQASGIWAQTR